MERRSHRRGVPSDGPNSREHSQTTRPRRFGVGSESQTASAPVAAKDLGRREGSQSRRLVLRFRSFRPRTVDVTTAGGTNRRIGDRRGSLARDGASLSEKNELKPWQKKMWCIPPKHNAEFVFHMENVLEVYQRPYDARF